MSIINPLSNSELSRIQIESPQRPEVLPPPPPLIQAPKTVNDAEKLRQERRNSGDRRKRQQTVFLDRRAGHARRSISDDESEAWSSLGTQLDLKA